VGPHLKKYYDHQIIDFYKISCHKSQRTLLGVVPWPFQHMSVECLINFEKNHFNKWNIPKYLILSFTIFYDLEEIIFKNLNISENNISSVELAKVLGH